MINFSLAFLTVILLILWIFLVFCWITCLVYMMAREKNITLKEFELKEKWFYLILFVVLTVLLGVLFYFLFYWR